MPENEKVDLLKFLTIMKAEIKDEIAGVKDFFNERYTNKDGCKQIQNYMHQKVNAIDKDISKTIVDNEKNRDKRCCKENTFLNLKFAGIYLLVTCIVLIMVDLHGITIMEYIPFWKG